MDIADLRSFLVIARHGNLRSAANELHQSASALSKAIRRLESALNTPLFDRIGKSIRLNTDGNHLRERAMQLVNLADQTQSEFRGARQQIHCRLVGPALLHWRYGPQMSDLLNKTFPGSGIAFVCQYEDAAIGALSRGEADFALVSGVLIEAGLPTGLECLSLGQMTMQLAAGQSHPILTQSAKATKPSKPPKPTKLLKSGNTTEKNTASISPARQVDVTTAQVLQYDFACPNRSLFCGLERGARSDGWRDDQLPRRIRFWLEDLQLLMALVRSGQALAYLPDFALADPSLVRLKVSDCAYECVEQAYLVWRPATASGWQNKLLTLLPKSLGS
jgi:DNA-binding transcriptional LysR family regulator